MSKIYVTDGERYDMNEKDVLLHDLLAKHINDVKEWQRIFITWLRANYDGGSMYGLAMERGDGLTSYLMSEFVPYLEKCRLRESFILDAIEEGFVTMMEV